MTWITASTWQSTILSAAAPRSRQAVDGHAHEAGFALPANAENMDGRDVDSRDSLARMRVVHAIGRGGAFPSSCWAKALAGRAIRDSFARVRDNCPVVHPIPLLSRRACG